MTADLKAFYRAANPSKTLDVTKEEDKKYYIDFSPVRGGQIIKELENAITWADEPTCQLFTGHVGCGKSTELLRLKAQLEEEQYHVVYFDSSADMEMSDVDVSDILLVIARWIDKSLTETEQIRPPKTAKFQEVFQGMVSLLQREVDLSIEATVPGGKVNFDSTKGFALEAMGIGKITAKLKDSPELRSKLRGILDKQTDRVIDAINQELIAPGVAQLQQKGKKGLVIIVDSLDKIEQKPKPWGRPQHEYLFIDRAEQLKALKCHVIYTMPLSLRFSNDFTGSLMQKFSPPKVLPMVPIQHKDGRRHEEGIELLQRMILSRAFPDLNINQTVGNGTAKFSAQLIEVFGDFDTLERLCYASGGHIRVLLRLLQEWIMRQRVLPLGRTVLEEVIAASRNNQLAAIEEHEWSLLRQVKQQRRVTGADGYQTLLRSLFVYEYCDQGSFWNDVNPILKEAEELSYG